MMGLGPVDRLRSQDKLREQDRALLVTGTLLQIAFYLRSNVSGLPALAALLPFALCAGINIVAPRLYIKIRPVVGLIQTCYPLSYAAGPLPPFPPGRFPCWFLLIWHLVLPSLHIFLNLTRTWVAVARAAGAYGYIYLAYRDFPYGEYPWQPLPLTAFALLGIAAPLVLHKMIAEPIFLSLNQSISGSPRTSSVNIDLPSRTSCEQTAPTETRGASDECCAVSRASAGSRDTTRWRPQTKRRDAGSFKLLGVHMNMMTDEEIITLRATVAARVAKLNGLRPDMLEVNLADGCIMFLTSLVQPTEGQAMIETLNLLTPDQYIDLLPERLRGQVTGHRISYSTGASVARPSVHRCVPIVIPPEEETTVTLTCEAPPNIDLESQWVPLVLSTRTGKEIKPVFYFWSLVPHSPTLRALRIVLPPSARLDCLRMGIKLANVDESKHIGEGQDWDGDIVGDNTSRSNPQALPAYSILLPSSLPVLETGIVEEALSLTDGVEFCEDLAALMAALNARRLEAKAKGKAARPLLPQLTITAAEMQTYAEMSRGCTCLVRFLRDEVVPAADGLTPWGSDRPVSRWDMDWLLRFRDPALETEFNLVSVRRYECRTYTLFRVVYTATFVFCFRYELWKLFTFPQHFMEYVVDFAVVLQVVLQRMRLLPVTSSTAPWILALHAFQKVYAMAVQWKPLMNYYPDWQHWAPDRPGLRWFAIGLVGTHAWTQERVPVKFNLVMAAVGSLVWIHKALFDHEFISGTQVDIPAWQRIALSQIFMLLLPTSLHYWGEYRERRAMAMQHQRKHTIAVSDLVLEKQQRKARKNK